MTNPFRTVATVLFALACGVGPLSARAEGAPPPSPSETAQAQPPQQQSEFIPIDQLPPQDQLPAAPLLIGAYAFVLAMLFLYVVSVSRRLGTVQRELARVESQLKRSGRP